MGRKHLNIALMRRRRAAQAAALSGARTLVRYEAEALALDFTDNYFYSTTSLYGSAYVKDTGTPANNYDSTPYGLLTYTSPSAKMTRGPNGLLRFGAHNLLLESETFNSATWSKSDTTVSADVTSAPNGSATADKIIEAATTTIHFVGQPTINYVAGSTYTHEVRAKAAERSVLQIVLTNTSAIFSNDYANFDLAGGTITAQSTLVAASMTALGDGWYLCSVTETAAATGSGGFALVIQTSTTASRSQAYAGDGTSGIYLWGAHLRRTPSDSTYLATTTAARYALPYEWDASGNLQGILVEEARTNLALQSENFATTWANDATTETVNSVAAPDGLTTADRVVETTANSNHGIYQNFTGSTSLVTYTASVFLKAGERTHAYVQIADGAGPRKRYSVLVDLAAGTILVNRSLNTPTGTAHTIEAFANGWHRVSVTLTNSAAATCVLNVYLADSASPSYDATYDIPTYAGNASNGIYVWGAQFELGSFPTSYIPTLASTVTRAADNITLATSKFPWDAATDSVYAKFRPLNVAAERRAIQLDDSTANERFTVGSDASANGFAQIVDGGATQLGPLTTGTVTTTAFEQMALAFAANDVALSSDGGAAATDTSATVPTVTTLRFGSGGSAASPLNGILAKALIVPRRVPNADLQTLTGTGVLPPYVPPSGPVNGIQLETGDYLLTEAGDYLVQEA